MGTPAGGWPYPYATAFGSAGRLMMYCRGGQHEVERAGGGMRTVGKGAP